MTLPRTGARPPSLVSRRTVLAGLAGGAAAATTALPATGQSAKPSEQWRYTSSDFSNLVAAGGRFYVSSGETVQAIDATSGSVVWTAGTSGAVPHGGLSVDAPADTVVTLTDGGTAIAHDRTDGTERWRRGLGGEGVGTAVADGTAFSLTRSTVTATDVRSGTIEWTHDVSTGGDGPRRGLTVATVDGSPQPVYHTAHLLVGIDSDGNETWRVEPSKPAFSDRLFWHRDNNIVAADQYVYFLADKGRHGLVDAASGSLVWERMDDYVQMGSLEGSPSVVDGRIVTSGADASVLSVPGGSKQWGTGLETYGAIGGTERALYVGGGSGGTAQLRSFAPNGTINWQLELGAFDPPGDYGGDFEFGRVTPAVTDTSIAFVFQPDDGSPTLYCYRLPESEWIGDPVTEGTATDQPSETTRTDVTERPRTDTQSRETTYGPPTERDPETIERGFFTNGGDGPLAFLSETGLTAVSTGITVVGIALSLVEMLRGGDQ